MNVASTRGNIVKNDFEEEQAQYLRGTRARRKLEDDGQEEIEEKTFVINRMYMDVLSPVVELLRGGNVEQAKRLYTTLSQKLEETKEEPKSFQKKKR